MSICWLDSVYAFPEFKPQSFQSQRSFLNTKIDFKWTLRSLDIPITSSTSVNNKILIGAGPLTYDFYSTKECSLCWILESVFLLCLVKIDLKIKKNRGMNNYLAYIMWMPDIAKFLGVLGCFSLLFYQYLRS